MEKGVSWAARYKIINCAHGKRFQFFCDLSGMLMYTTGLIKAATAEQALSIAWQGAKKHFNLCHKCGKWVSDIMYNADTLKCVDCSPWEDVPKYCKFCGERVDKSATQFCHKCGARLRYGGDDNAG